MRGTGPAVASWRMSSVEVELALTSVAAMLSPITLTFSVLALSRRPGRTGLWFFLGACGTTLLIGIVAALVLGDAAAAPKQSSEPPTWVAVFDLVASVLLLLYVVRTLRRPRDPRRERDAMNRMSKLASSPAIAIVAAGAALANPGAFIPIALKDVSQLKPSAGAYAAIWTAFTLVALLPLLVALAVSRERATAALERAHRWLQRHARTMGAVIVVLLAAALLRNGIAGLTS